MNQRTERRRKNRRASQAIFYDAINDRRRPEYERRGRTTVRPMPLTMAVRGDKRRFEESGTE
jgi:hypothetical protein